MPLTVERLRELLDYDEKENVFTWRVNRAGAPFAGKVAGCPHNGTWEIRVDGRKYGKQSLATFYQTGRWPASEEMFVPQRRVPQPKKVDGPLTGGWRNGICRSLCSISR